MIPRRDARFGAQFPITFTGDYEGEGLVTNVSTGGCCVEQSNIALDEHAMLKAFLFLTFEHLSVKVEAAIVRWVSLPTFGLQFVLMNADERHRLQQYLIKLFTRSSSAN